MNDENESDDRHDPVVNQLRAAANAGRPVISAKLRGDILRRVDLERSGSTHQTKFRILQISSAAAVLAIVVLIEWPHYHHDDTLVVIAPPSNVPPTASSMPTQVFSEPFHIGTVISAQAFPPRIEIRLPIVTAGVTEPADTVPQPSSTVPDMVVAKLSEPAVSAQSVLSDLVPPSVQQLVQFLQQSPKNN